MSETHNFRIIAVTIDEGIPGYRDEALEIVKSFCSKLDVEFRTNSYKELYDVTLSESLELRDEEKTTSCSICGIFTHTRPRINPKLYMIIIACIEGVDPFLYENVSINDGNNHPLDQKK